MSIEQTDKIDFLSTDPASGVVTLTITDHLAWGDGRDDQHITLLQQKFETYLQAVESGEIYVSYPNARNHPLRIEVVSKHTLTEYAKEFFDYAKRFGTDLGIAISFRQL